GYNTRTEKKYFLLKNFCTAIMETGGKEMASPQHLKLLQESILDWNEWRENHPEILPDLNEADLSGANLIRANLSRANLSEANLSEANFSEANFSRANFSRANFSGANLSRATLVETNLTQANLTACQIYGISAWDLQLVQTKQNNLVITRKE